MSRAVSPAEQFDDLDQQSGAATFGMWVFLATEVLFFGVLFAAYAYGRVQDPQGFALASRHTDLLLGGIESVILLLSAALAAWATALLRRDETRASANLLWGAAGLGALFMALHLYEYWKDYGEGLVPGLRFTYSGLHAQTVERFYALYYAMTLVHLLHLLIGIVLLAVYARAVRRQRIDAAHASPVMCVALYWDFVDMVWIFLFPMLYLVDRS
jgi:cytochrome c oxidase subunit III